MCNDMSFKIDVKGLAEDVTSFQYALDNEYFEAIEAPDIKAGKLQCELVVRKVGSCFELDFHTEGVVQIPCDRCLENMDQPINTDNRLVVRFGEEYSEDDELVTITEAEGMVDVAWFIYEFIALSIPVQHSHELEDCNQEMVKLLAEYQNAGNETEEKTETDPRWSKLSELIGKN